MTGHNDCHAQLRTARPRDWLPAMRAALYRFTVTWAGTWRAVAALALVGGLLGAVALGAVAGARRTASAYGRYVASIRASDAFVNIPGVVPGMTAAQSLTLISRLPGITASAGYLGLNANPVVHGKVDDSFLTDDLTGSLAGPGFTADGFGQDRMTVLAGRLPAVGSTDQVALTPSVARTFGVGVGGRVTYQLYHQDFQTGQNAPACCATFRVTALVDIPPFLPTRPTRRMARFSRPPPPGGCSRRTSTGGSGSGWAAASPGYQRSRPSWPGWPAGCRGRSSGRSISSWATPLPSTSTAPPSPGATT